jgi:hypothetical protein
MIYVREKLNWRSKRLRTVRLMSSNLSSRATFMKPQEVSELDDDDTDSGSEYLCECDCCHDMFALEQIRVAENGTRVYCDKCLSEGS